MRWSVPVVLLSLAAVGCTPARFVCTKPSVVPPPVQECDLGANQGKEFPFENLAVEGGGVKGIAYGGALAVLEQAGVQQRLKRVAGTSAGSITAMLIALGYNSEELQTVLLDLDLEQFRAGGAEGPVRLVEEFGWYNGDVYLEWAQCQVENKTGDRNTTFLELHQRNQEKKLPDLYVVTTDLTRSNWAVLSHETVPCMPVALAVRLSGSLPFFWNALRLNLKDFQPTPGGTCPRVQSSRTGDVFADGGVLLNYPIPLFDVEPYLGGVEGVNPKTLGLHLNPPPGPARELQINNLPDYAKSVAEAYLQSQVDYFETSPCDQVRSVQIDDLGIKTTDFNLTREQKLKLMQSGFDATCAYLRDWTPEELGRVCRSAAPTRTQR
ncbi:MAG TPA: patatin-like phospholipase family protein [Thermoanaerobaculia bacterium]